MALACDESRDRYYMMNVDKGHIAVLIPVGEIPPETEAEANRWLARYVATYNRGDQNVANIFWWGTDPSSLYSLYHSSSIPSGFNWAHYKNTTVDKLLGVPAYQT